MRSDNAKIMFVLPGWITTVVGGAEWQCHLLSQQYLQRGCDVQVLSMKRPLMNPEYFDTRIQYASYTRRVLKSHMLGFLVFFWRIIRLSPNYIIVRTDARMERSVCFLYSRLTNAQMIFSLASDLDIENNPNRRVMKKGAQLLSWVRSGEHGFIDYIAKKSFGHLRIVAQNEYQFKSLKEMHHPSDYVLIPNSYSGDTVRDEEVDTKQDVVLWVANFKEVKRPEKFIELAKHFSGDHLRFKMIGSLNDYPIANIAEEDVRNLEVLGPLSRVEVVREMKTARWVVNTSDSEGFSNVFLESWAQGCAVYTLGVNPDGILDDPRMGRVFNSVEEMARELENRQSDSLDRDEILWRRDSVLERFNLDKNFTAYCEFMGVNSETE